MCIIVNKMDWGKKKARRWPTLSKKVQSLCAAPLGQVPGPGNTGSTPGGAGSGRIPCPRAAPAAAAVCRSNAGPRITLAPGSGPGPAAAPPRGCRRTLPTEKELGKERLRFNPDSSGPPSPYSPSFTEIEGTHVPISHLLEGSCGVCADRLNAEL